MFDDEATQFSYFRDNELTQLAEIETKESSPEIHKALEVGTLFLNKYKIVKLLGEGSFSLIYLLEANDASKKLLVAKEFFPKGFVTRNNENEVIIKTSLSDKEIENYQFMKDIFIGEAKNLVKVSSRTHHNVLSFFSLEENVNNTMYLITDYEEGITLKDYLKERKKEYKGKLNTQEVSRLLQDLLDGLEHIHNVNIYHQDIKLENILIRQNHRPLLLDFGASVILYDEKRKKYFNATTPRYAAPEQIELAQPPAIDQRSDIYALGVMAYKLVTDTFPPQARERMEALDAQHDDPYVPLEAQKTYGYDAVLLMAIDKALNLLPEQRFQNANEFKQALLEKSILTTLPSIKILLAFMIPIVAFLTYLLWPISQGTAKLNLKEKSYFVYNDGKKVDISEEKTILLPTGKHKLTFIKDGYIPCEINTTITSNKITNIYATLIPSTHMIQLSATLEDVTFIVNNEKIHGTSFEGKYGESYKIQTIALNHPIETVETTYEALYKKHFRFYQKLKSENKTIHIDIQKLLDMGETEVLINNKVIKDNTFIIEDGQKYTIKILNPYYKPKTIEKSYNELQKVLSLNVQLEQAKGRLVIEGLPTGVKIETFAKLNNINKKIDAKISYNKQKYNVETDAYDNIYFKLSKVGYKTQTTSTFSLKHNQVGHQNYTLSKIVPIEKPNIVASPAIVKKMIPKKVPPATVVIKPTVKPKTVIHKNTKTIKKRKKPIKKHVNKKVDKMKSKHTKVNRPSIKKKHQKAKVSSGSIWFCMTSGGTSAKAKGKHSASRLAISRCKAKRNINCHISSCYIWQ